MLKFFSLLTLALYSFHSPAQEMSCAEERLQFQIKNPTQIGDVFIGQYGNDLYSTSKDLKTTKPLDLPKIVKVLGIEDHRYLYAIQSNGRIDQKFDLTNPDSEPIIVSEEEVARKFGGMFKKDGNAYFFDKKNQKEIKLPAACNEVHVRTCIVIGRGLLLFTKNPITIQLFNLEGSMVGEYRWNFRGEEYKDLFVDNDLNLINGNDLYKLDPFSGNFVSAGINDHREYFNWGDPIQDCGLVKDNNFKGICTATGYNGNINYLYLTRGNCREIPQVLDCEELDQKETAKSALKLLDDVGLKLACQSDFDEKLWDSLTPDKNPLTKDEAIKWLYRFSKPGGYNEQKHQAILKGIYNSGLAKYFENQISQIGIQNGYVGELTQPLSFNNSCLSDKEKEKIQPLYYERIKKSLQYNPKLTQKNYDQIKLYLPILTSTQIDNIVRDLSDIQLLEVKEGGRTRDDEALSNVSNSKIVHYLESVIQKKLGLPYRDYNDVAIIQDGYEIKVLRLSVSPFSKSAETEYGIHVNVLNSINKKSFTGSQKIELSFKASEKKHSASISINPVEGVLFDKAPSPKYEELLNDKVLRGLIITNQVDDNGYWTMDAYMAYYTRNGCIFDRSKFSEVDTKMYLQKRVAGPEVADYLIKEAHSGGDDMNLFSYYPKSKLLSCQKQNSDGTQEEVELLIPIVDNSYGHHITSADFADWMDNRVKSEKGQLLYINSSCYSRDKAIYEIPAVAEKNPEAAQKLVNIASTSYVYFYRDPSQRRLSLEDQNNSKRFMLDGIRNKKTYQEIRDSMKNDPRYSAGTGNQFIFPDEKSYQTKIGDTLATPVSINIKTFVEDNKGGMREYTLSNY
ncbi:MAG: hypothetical protein AB7I27_15230 [Bacteriovoracaceae bacterium]